MRASDRVSRVPILLALLTLLSTTLGVSSANAQSSPYRDIAVSFASVDNLQPSGFRFLITLENRGDQPLPASGWELYFNMMRMLDTEGAPPAVRIEHINGDFYRITPSAEFRGLEPGGRLVLPLVGNAMAVKHGDAPRGFYFVADGEIIALDETDVAPFVHDAQTMRSAADNLPVPTPASRFESDAVVSLLDEAELMPITPTPVRYESLDGTWALDSRAVVQHEAGLRREARFLVDALEPVIGARLEAAEGGGQTGGIALRVDEDLGAESYTLMIEPDRGGEGAVRRPVGAGEAQSGGAVGSGHGGADRLALVRGALEQHAVGQIRRRVIELRPGQHELLVRLGIHEMKVVPVAVEELNLTLVEIRKVNLRAELLDVGVESLDLQPRERIAHAFHALIPVGGGRVVVGGCDHRFDAPGFAPGFAQAFVGLGARHLMHEVAVDVEERRAVVLDVHDMARPELVVESLSHVRRGNMGL
jgi:hypothetical protein